MSHERNFDADGSSSAIRVSGESAHIAMAGDFGGGTVAVEYRVNDTWYPLLNEQVAITFTAANNSGYNVNRGDIIRLTLSGSTSPDLDYKISSETTSVVAT